MSGNPAVDLARWIPRLLSVWRARQGGAGRRAPRENHAPGRGRRARAHAPEALAPVDRLTPDELRRVAAGVRRLSLGLTRERSLAGARYMDDPALLGAYLLFYWPVSYAQARAVLTELPGSPGATLDLGAGPGPMAFAALDAGASTAVAADRSAGALELARALAREADESLTTRPWSPERPLPPGDFDLIVMGHVLNELYGGDVTARVALISRALERLRPRGTLLVIEPALRDTSRALLQVRDVLVARDHSVRAPCLFRGACPALLRPADWCHAERAWSEPPLVAAVARAAGLHKETLKMSYLLVAPSGEPWPERDPRRLFRIVSEPLAGKGRARLMACGPEGRLGLALQDKHRGDGNAAFSTLARGDVVALSGAEPRGDGLSLGEGSTVHVVAPAGRRLIPPGSPDAPRSEPAAPAKRTPSV